VARWLSTALENSANAVLNSHNYTYNGANRRTQQVFSAGNYINYAYDSEGELLSAIGQELGGADRLQEQFGYAYDPAGNLNFRTNNALLQAFNVNAANELTTETNSGTLTVAGTTTPPATNIAVNGSTASLYADATFALGGFTVTNGNNSFTAIAKDSNGRRATNAITVNLPGTNTFTYDANGNLLSDGLRNFAYDDENQLITVWVTNTWQSQFIYDGKMRRRIRKEFTWSGSAWVETNEVHYVYDGTLVIQERNADNLSEVTYTRGADLSDSLQKASGIGGLLARSDNGQMIAHLPTAHAYYHADCNGNITCMVYTNQQPAAHYQYDPFGSIISESGVLAEANSYRFSSKEYHSSSSLLYYLHRLYDPHLQKWITRDPLNERGGQDIYEFVLNDPNNSVDPIGLACTEALGQNGKPLMVFTDPGGAWSLGIVSFSAAAGAGATQQYTIAKVTYTASVTVLCTCPCKLQSGVRVYEQEADGSWVFYKPGTVGHGVEVPVVKGVMNGLSKLGAKWIGNVLNTSVMLQYDADDAARELSTLPHPSEPSDGEWKDGKSPCAQ
jgi:RHS repeat-associated protein